MKTIFKSQKGVSMIEVVFTLAIVSALLIPFLALFLTGARDVKRIGNYNLAILFAQEAIESCKGYPNELLDSDESTDTGIDKKYYLEEAFKSGNKEDGDKYWNKADVNGVEYTRTVDIQKINAENTDIDNVKLKFVKVEVSWKYRGKDIKYSVSSILGGI